MQPGDHIGVVLNGDAAGNALLWFFQKLARNRKDIRVSGVPVGADPAGFAGRVYDAGVTRLALAISLEEAAARALITILQGRAGTDLPGAPQGCAGVPVIAPFSRIPAGEIALYARVHGIGGGGEFPEQENDPLYTDTKALLADYSRRHPAAPHAILNLCESLD
jgi:hypothetical protein